MIKISINSSEAPSPEELQDTLQKMRSAPVHWLENVDGVVWAGCRRFKFVGPPIDMEMTNLFRDRVTCVDCINRMKAVKVT